MKVFIKKLGLLIFFFLFAFSINAYDFEANGITYTITSLTDMEVRVDGTTNTDINQLHIPQMVEYKGKILEVTSIKYEAFKDYKNLIDITLPSSIRSIGTNAFENDSILVNISLPNNLESLGGGAFAGCISLEEIIIPEKITKIAARLFEGCRNLASIYLGSNVSTIGDYAFKDTRLIKIELPSSVTNIGNYAFSGTPIQSISIPEKIKIIPEYCFENCSKLESVDFQRIESIEAGAFMKCNLLNNIHLSENLRYIGDKAFYGCYSLEEFVIPSSVDHISPSILWACSKLKKIKFGKGLSGFPFIYKHGMNNSTSEIYTLGSRHTYDYYNWNINEYFLDQVNEVIIEDASEPFSIYGFRKDGDSVPPFENVDYYYVGRPLSDIKKWSCSYYFMGAYYKTEFEIAQARRGIGHIKTLEISGECTENPYFFQSVDTLKLGKKIIKFIPDNLYKENLVRIECFSTTPPIAPDNSFSTKTYTDITLCVPVGCKDTYSKATCWRNFWNIEEIDYNSMSGTNNILDSTESKLEESDRFDISGNRVSENYKGLVIIRYSDGSTRKQILK